MERGSHIMPSLANAENARAMVMGEMSAEPPSSEDSTVVSTGSPVLPSWMPSALVISPIWHRSRSAAMAYRAELMEL